MTISPVVPGYDNLTCGSRLGQSHLLFQAMTTSPVVPGYDSPHHQYLDLGELVLDLEGEVALCACIELLEVMEGAGERVQAVHVLAERVLFFL